MTLEFVVRTNGVEGWKFPGCKFRVAAVWRVIRPKLEKVRWHRLTWNIFVVPKHAVIAWMAILNRLPTKDRLKSWELEIEGTCVLCKYEEECRDHLFFGCIFSQ